jgi:hypothetical protein
MERKNYNGWTNYETWNCKLWMDNDEGSYGYFRELTEDIAKREDKEDRAEKLAKALENHFDEAAEEWMSDQASFFADILNAALGEVNWYEIAESLLDEHVDEEEEEEEEEETEEEEEKA